MEVEEKYDDWRTYRQKLKNDMPPIVNALIREAKLSNYWIFHKPKKKWYTPEEFAENYREAFRERKSTDNSEEFSVKDPMSGLHERIDLLKRTSEEIISFQKRINDYFLNRLNKK